MPTYEYKCKKCEETYEVYQSFTDDALTECPSGDGGEVRKVFGNVGIVFKGSGFYKTDSRKASSGNGSGKDRSKEKKDKTDKTSESSSTSTSSESSSSSSSSSGKAENAA